MNTRPRRIRVLKNRSRTRDEIIVRRIGTERSRDQHAGAISDHREDGLEGQRLPAKRPKRFVERFGNVSLGIDERSVEIEEESRRFG